MVICRGSQILPARAFASEGTGVVLAVLTGTEVMPPCSQAFVRTMTSEVGGAIWAKTEPKRDCTAMPTLPSYSAKEAQYPMPQTTTLVPAGDRRCVPRSATRWTRVQGCAPSARWP